MSEAKHEGQLRTGNRSSADGFKAWGLTGGIASGKSTAARFFADAGALVIDADQIARELSQEGGMAYPALVKRFGKVSREELRKQIFSDPDARADLEAILHPLIRAESWKRMQEFAKAHPKDAPLIIYEATLLVETGRYRDFEGLIVVQAPKALRKKRLVERNGFSEELAEQIISSQATDAERARVATHVLENSGNMDSLKKQVLALIPKLKSKSS